MFVDAADSVRGVAEPEVLRGRRCVVDMTGSLSLSNGPGSLNAGPFPARLGTTLGINDTGRVTVPLDKRLPDGP